LIYTLPDIDPNIDMNPTGSKLNLTHTRFEYGYYRQPEIDPTRIPPELNRTDPNMVPIGDLNPNFT